MAGTLIDLHGQGAEFNILAVDLEDHRCCSALDGEARRIS